MTIIQLMFPVETQMGKEQFVNQQKSGQPGLPKGKVVEPVSCLKGLLASASTQAGCDWDGCGSVSLTQTFEHAWVHLPGDQTPQDECITPQPCQGSQHLGKAGFDKETGAEEGFGAWGFGCRSVLALAARLSGCELRVLRTVQLVLMTRLGGHSTIVATSFLFIW